ncbi:DUF3256 family protein [Dysgonomonas sp. 521]|uniref:DUF3256 family protein n=1 Tax=Dysgonomonas sp. 521 TaxID=2302932 RepID=UPI0013D283C0|nr:DUF3256 family protein [Dysgonomonas sp. 521]NDV94590.1 DUF3256 family protein [Dysgonomonas sp. 521]
MKKIILAITLLFSTIITASAQDISTVFLTMPENLVFGLDAAGKDKLLSNPGDTAGVSVNRSGMEAFGEVTRVGISHDYISLQTSESGMIQIKLLPLINDSQIICVVKTVCGKACDSQIQFYTTKWIPILQGDLFPKINKDTFIIADTDRNSQEFRNAYAALDMNPITIELSADDTSIEASYDIESYLTSDDYKMIEPFLIENPKKYIWDKLSFKPE